MSTQKNLITLCIATVFTLGLAACGGGGGGSSDAPPVTSMMDGDEPALTPAEQLTAAQDAVTAAQALVDSASTSSEIAAAYAALATAQMKLSAAESIPANQIALLAARLEQARIDLQNTQMLAEQRGTVGAALIAAQNLVNGLSAASSDADAAAASAAVAAAQAVLANASALPADDSLHGSVAAVADLLASVDMSRTVYSQRGTVDTALTAAQMAVGGLSNASTDEDVAAARTAVMAAQAELALAMALSADDPRHASVMGVYDSLGDAVTMRTAHMDTQTINGLIATALTAVDGLDQVTSSGMAVADARAALDAVQAAIAGSTALTDDAKAGLSAEISMAVTDLQGVDDYRATAPGQLAVAESALERANALVDALTPTSTAAQAAEAYGALGVAQAAIHAAKALPANVIARLTDSLNTANKDLGDANRLAGERETVGNAIVAATTVIAGLTADSTEADIESAKELVTAAQTALSETMEMSEDEKAGLGQTIVSLGTQIGNVETLQMAAEAERMQTEQRNAALTALSMAQAAINGLNVDSPEEMVDAARVLVTAAQTALDAADGLSQAESDGLQMLVTAADSSVTGYETIVAARPDPVVVAANTAEAVTKETAIKEAAKDPNAGLGGETPYSFSIKRDGDGTTIKIDDDPMPKEDDPKFAQMADLGKSNGFDRTKHVREMEADADGDVVTEIVIVSTDIEEPMDIPFVIVDGMGRYTLNANKNDDGELQSLTVSTTFEVGLAMLKDSRVTVPAPDGSVTLMSDDTGTDDVNENEYSGTFDGADGTFTCTNTGDAGCVVMVEEGKITDMDGVHFTPEEDATVSEPDADYLYYGFWLKKTTDEDGVLTYNEVDAFVGSSEMDGSNVIDVTGSATYKGGATGVYVHSVTKTDGTRESATAGQFKADAELTATFGQVLDDDDVGTIAANLVHTISSGTIDNFVLEHGEEHRWSVSLEKADITLDTGVVPLGVAKGGGADGSYTATFYGDTAEYDHDDDDTTTMIARQPSSVGGEFNANFSNGSAVGAFGARK